MSYRYELDFVWDVKGSIPSITPFKHEKYHEDLEKALFTLNRDLNKKNYTADTVLEVDNNSSNTTFFATSDVFILMLLIHIIKHMESKKKALHIMNLL